MATVSWYALNWQFPLPSKNTKGIAMNVLSAEGETLRQFADSSGTFRIPVDVGDVSTTYLDSLLAYEDSRFYSHNGVDIKALLRAAYQRLRYGEIVSGGSTITMQVARVLYPIERSYGGKLVQIFRALQLEQQYSKQEILSLYLTHVPMGGNIEGVEAASQRYFGKSSHTLNISEAALLTVIPQRPSLYRPDRYPEQAMQARNKVLRRLIDEGVVSKQEYELLKDESVVAGRMPIKRKVPLLARELKTHTVGQSAVGTFIVKELQQNVDSIVAQRFTALSDELSVAVMVVENKSGEVLAYKGSLDMDNARNFGHVDMTKAVRSPGSTLKPFVYAKALDEGLVHSESLLLDIPMEFGDYKPQNFDKRFQGEVSVSEALQRSKNVSAVYLLSQIGVPEFVDGMQVMSSSLRLADMNLTVVLGGGGSTLRELVMYYTALSREGVSIKPRLSIDSPIEEARIISAESAWITKAILQDLRAPDRPRAKYGRKIAWKTGTSFGYRDAWAIGTSEDYTVGVWMGRPDGSPYVGQTGATMAAPILFDVFDLLPKDSMKNSRPESVERVQICWPGGLAKAMVDPENCLDKRTAWTIDGVTPRTLRRDMRLSSSKKWPQELMSWKQKHSQSDRFIDIIQPQDGSHIYPYQGQLLTLKASSQDVRWYLDGAVSASSIEAQSLSGQHEIKACNRNSCNAIKITVH
ncbi:penicillin-binding protein 1C [Vibrio breoganii]|uniref:penicillin-binding protein 1C n=1 Tax=Vibrio breoganii TaxID=553239 RepID=UPI000CC5E3CF|nr:penicillin-binding protein 1C [Vibrio breoganii]PMJ45329.1 penicillin-binding protein 1C [Vibrio breoganii]PMK59443.1 penicillin-binding protein 1C [Vibrio breoganii]PMO29242.1 penicillin-binding protein 1C [Vibrio breoganii]PMO32922.1 penicillin-binding protein 1C [Vibrio breoganii]PMO66204.1 penicillin-binding protein 1C [Vibrio breoganii]